MDKRQKFITKDLDLTGSGLEIAPLFRPIISKNEYNIYYTDYASAEQLKDKNQNNVNLTSGCFPLIVDLDFVWYPGSSLSKCAPPNVMFDYAIASHVIEHVPNLAGWINEILSVLKVGGKLALAVPNKQSSFDYYRQNTTVAEIVDAWIRNASTPSPLQIFDCLSLAAVDIGQPGTRSFDLGIPVKEAELTYSLDEALNFAIEAYETGTYLDIHCSVFTPDSFVDVVQSLVDLKILNVSLSTPMQGEPAGAPNSHISAEFSITLTKLGEPERTPPTLLATEDSKAAVNKDLQHARQAFDEAIEVQLKLKKHIEELENMTQLKLLKQMARRLLNRAR